MIDEKKRKDDAVTYQDGVVIGMKPMLLTWEIQEYMATFRCPNCKYAFEMMLVMDHGEPSRGPMRCMFCGASLLKD